MRVVLSPSNVWRVAFVVAAVIAVVLFLRFVLTDAGTFIFLLVMAWFLSLAMEPAVAWLARRMRRGAATGLVMAGFGLAAGIFLLLFGQLLVQQVALLVSSLPDVVTAVIQWVNTRLGTKYEISDILEAVRLTPQQAAGYAQGLLEGVLGLVGALAGLIFNAFTLALLVFYLSADGPRLRRWIAARLAGRFQDVFVSVWDLSTIKTGGYVAARLILAAINGATSTVVFLLLGMPSWLALGVWTGVVAQFVPTIGTYIAIALPTVVGLASPRPWIGVAALIWAVIYQQVENLTLEPRISARSVDIHPGVSFSAAILGALLFGAAGALLAIPVVAMLLSVMDTFVDRHELQPAVTKQPGPEQPGTDEKPGAEGKPVGKPEPDEKPGTGE